MRFIWASDTHTGLVRENNEDAIHPRNDGYTAGPLLVGVADGLGGARYGEVASRIAIEVAARAGGRPWQRVRAANASILERVLRQPKYVGMGTTLTLAMLDPLGGVELGHVGDSRAYLLRDAAFRRLTVDHTFVQEEIEAGRLTEEKARTHPQRAYLTRALGFARDLTVDIGQSDLRPGDRLLLCSDGLTSMLSDDGIAAILATGPPSAVSWGLIEAANAAGGHDNVSVVVVTVTPGAGGEPGRGGGEIATGAIGLRRSDDPA